MREFNEKITKKDIEEIYEALTKFDSYISYITRNPTDENIGLYEHWIDCRYDIEELIINQNK